MKLNLELIYDGQMDFKVKGVKLMASNVTTTCSSVLVGRDALVGIDTDEQFLSDAGIFLMWITYKTRFREQIKCNLLPR